MMEILDCCSQMVLRFRKLTQRQVRLLMANQVLGSSLYSLKKNLFNEVYIELRPLEKGHNQL